MTRLTRWAAGLSVALVFTTAHAQSESWRLVKDEDGIKVYLQNIQGSKYQAYRGVTTIKAPLEKLVAMQEDVSSACNWIHSCIKQTMLSKEGNQGVLYSQFETPWPVQSRDAVFQVSSKQEASGAILRQLSAAADYKPAEKGFIRVSKAEGYWRLTPVEGGVEVVYQMHTEPGGSVPGWLANSFVVDAPFNTLKQWRKLAEQEN